MRPPPTVPPPSPWWRGPLLPFVILIAVTIVALILVANVFDLPVGARRDGPFLALAAGLGITVGASEIITRYRDEPGQALNTVGAILYVALNGLVSAAAYGLLATYADSLFPGLAGDRLMTSLVAGLAAMAVLRSRVFTLRTEAGEDIAVGPDAAVTAFLNAADRAIDRKRASRRMSMVFSRASDTKLQDVKLSKPFLEIALAAMQNVPREEKQTLVAYLQTVADSGYPEDLKLQAMCYALLGVTGERNFNDIMSNLLHYMDRHAAPTRQPPVAPATAPAPAPAAVPPASRASGSAGSSVTPPATPPAAPPEGTSEPPQP
jgi:hypothetical protein